MTAGAFAVWFYEACLPSQMTVPHGATVLTARQSGCNELRCEVHREPIGKSRETLGYQMIVTVFC